MRRLIERKYHLTTGQLIDRLCIVTLKSIKISEHKEEYEKEAQAIMDDLNTLVNIKDAGQLIRAVQVNAVCNEIIWQNESKARAGGNEQDNLLKFTHSVNGIRNLAMNVISQILGERKDMKLDCLAAELCKQKGYDFGGIFNESSDN